MGWGGEFLFLFQQENISVLGELGLRIIVFGFVVSLVLQEVRIQFCRLIDGCGAMFIRVV